LSRQILCVDDSVSVRTQVRAALEPHGVTVVEAGNGVEGLWQARQRSFDLVLVDVHMPIMDGLRMVEELRKLPDYAQTPVFVLTSDAAGTRMEEGKRVGAHGWLLKPFKPDMLWRVVDRALFGRSTPSAGRVPVLRSGNQ
jgi:two-component system, chemotaxis family, chemotaxis protein CheY